MNAKNDKPKTGFITSRNLDNYKLNKRHKNILERWGDMKKYMALAGKVPACVRLNLTYYSEINATVRAPSDGKRELSDCQYQGVPILSTERSPQTDFVS